MRAKYNILYFHDVFSIYQNNWILLFFTSLLFLRVSNYASNSSLLFNPRVILALTSTILLPETLFLLPSARNSLSLATGWPVGLKYLGQSPNQVLRVYAKRSAECSLLLEDQRISVAMVVQNSQQLEPRNFSKDGVLFIPSPQPISHSPMDVQKWQYESPNDS